ncbi:G-type lectin S-receptor-like serine/threonine-protein kinase At4g27290 isoform X1 [Actinidia eriantha]|uniref:G-type lectin S-receptor-like serine/threonine-protein kinase At4g27290 isoform X1 n=1 Tax=Actinidia eriantha TaxID=165200 RepID=UPI0025837E12|nr:G-type lectin S-receptor-like serine/threonine-protein kinase At4g27290 isoform X1 [Actinidia eriantha]
MEAFNIFLFFSTLFLIKSAATDTIAANQTLRDGDTIVSAGGSFEMGFFSPGSSQNRYFGIWYKSIASGTVVWVANRAIPLTDTSGVLKVVSPGILVLLNSSNCVIWSSNMTRSLLSPVAQLLDTGNLVVRDESDSDQENFLWQSFDYQGDTFLPGMKFGKDFRTGLDRYWSSWKSVDDPSPGDYTNRFDTNGYPQIFLRRGSVIQFRTGPWNGLRFSGLPSLLQNPIYTFQYVFNQDEVYYQYELVNSSVVSRMELSSGGVIQRFTWINRTQGWVLYMTAQMDTCDRYALCGPYGSCNIDNSPACGCLKGFEPKAPGEWNVADWSDGCVRRTPLECGNGDGFLKYTGVKLPDTQYSWFNTSMNLMECKKMCLKNCSCNAYASLDVRGGGSGCLLWFGDLIDIRQCSANGQDLYVRMAASELEEYRSSSEKRRVLLIAIPVSVLGMLFLSLFLLLHLSKKRKSKREGMITLNPEKECTDEKNGQVIELPLFDFPTIAKATNYFSVNNKLGEGGFGPVYKGMLEKGQQIAVKRLSKSSKQGLDEFKNEVLCIAKLQHRNLVKLLGCCIEEEEQMLIYEYLPNKSLDSFIFDEKRSKFLDWPKRHNIINGIARGLLYLHQDSRLRIIHRDLKASNILLDYDMNSKISDFGLARIFGGNETSANTTRVVGTYGYMSPEYAIDGLFSIKSDVFSFGVLVLEIISGNKNRGFYHGDHSLNLLGHAWSLHKEGKSLELIDMSLVESFNLSEVVRSIHIGLLCVQQSPEDRPTMSMVVLMLCSDMALPQPKQPGFFSERNFLKSDSFSTKGESHSANLLTLSYLGPR